MKRINIVFFRGICFSFCSSSVTIKRINIVRSKILVIGRGIYNCWEQAEKDFEGDAKNLKINEYYITAFLSQQAAEKRALKALYIHKKEHPLVPQII
ncbi:HEPN domain-containing protein [Methanothermobacter wolfeii]|uniref:HEPN domain-containing protein n=1 Tax=Methanothermobacter wolfeii TaxID=145261 RepID=A0ABU8TUM2_METWO